MAILKFSQSPNYYYDKALKSLENGDYINGVDNLFETIRALNECDSADDSVDIEEVSLNLADAYLDMGLDELALREYFRTMSLSGEIDSETQAGLVECYRRLGHSQAAMYYAISAAKEDSEFMEGLLNFMQNDFDINAMTGEKEQKEKPPIRLVKSKDDFVIPEFNKEERKLLRELGRGMYSEKKPETRQDYIEMRTFLAMCYLQQGKAERGLRSAKMAMDACEGTVPPRVASAYIIALSESGRKQEALDEAEKFANFSSDAYDDNMVLANTMAQIGNQELTLKFAEEALKKEPYVKDINLLKIQSLYNTGKRDEAKKVIVQLQKVFRDDPILKIYARKIAYGNEDKISTPYLLYGADAQKAISIARNALEEPSDKVITEYYENEEAFDSICFTIDNAYEEFQIKLFERLAKSKAWAPYLEDKLLDPSIGPIPKSHLLFALITERGLREIDIVPNFIFHRKKFSVPKNVVGSNDATFKAYAYVYSILLCADTDFEQNLKSVYKSAVPNIKSEYEYKVIAAYLISKCNVDKVFGTVEGLAKIFDVKEDEIRRLSAEVEENEKQTTELKRRNK